MTTMEAIGEHVWGLREIGETYPAPVLCIIARRRAGMTQQDLAQRLGTHRSRIAKIENGRLPLDISLLTRWATATSADPALLARDLAP